MNLYSNQFRLILIAIACLLGHMCLESKGAFGEGFDEQYAIKTISDYNPDYTAVDKKTRETNLKTLANFKKGLQAKKDLAKLSIGMGQSTFCWEYNLTEINLKNINTALEKIGLIEEGFRKAAQSMPNNPPQVPTAELVVATNTTPQTSSQQELPPPSPPPPPLSPRNTESPSSHQPPPLPTKPSESEEKTATPIQLPESQKVQPESDTTAPIPPTSQPSTDDQEVTKTNIAPQPDWINSLDAASERRDINENELIHAFLDISESATLDELEGKLLKEKENNAQKAFRHGDTIWNRAKMQNGLTIKKLLSAISYLKQQTKNQEEQEKRTQWLAGVDASMKKNTEERNRERLKKKDQNKREAQTPQESSGLTTHKKVGGALIGIAGIAITAYALMRAYRAYQDYKASQNANCDPETNIQGE